MNLLVFAVNAGSDCVVGNISFLYHDKSFSASRDGVAGLAAYDHFIRQGLNLCCFCGKLSGPSLIAYTLFTTKQKYHLHNCTPTNIPQQDVAWLIWLYRGRVTDSMASVNRHVHRHLFYTHGSLQNNDIPT